MCPAECAAGPQTGHCLSCVLSQMVVPAFPWSLELGQRRQEPGFIKDLLERQTNTVTDVVTVHPLQAAAGHPHSLPCLRLEGKIS